MGIRDLSDPNYDQSHIVGGLEAELERVRDIACSMTDKFTAALARAEAAETERDELRDELERIQSTMKHLLHTYSNDLSLIPLHTVSKVFGMILESEPAEAARDRGDGPDTVYCSCGNSCQTTVSDGMYMCDDCAAKETALNSDRGGEG